MLITRKEWWKAAGIRAIRTVAQTAVAAIGTAALLSEVNWLAVASASVLAGILGAVLWGVFHGRTDTVFIYSIVTESPLSTSAFSTKTSRNTEESAASEPPSAQT